MTELILRMNDVLMQWKAKYDILAMVSLEFKEDPAGLLLLNQFSLPRPKYFVIQSAAFTAEYIIFFFDDASKIEIKIDWMEDDPPVVSFARYILPLDNEGSENGIPEAFY